MKKRKINAVPALLALLVGICLTAYAGRQLWETKQIYREGNMVYDGLADLVKKNAAAGLSAAGSSGETYFPIPGLEIGFEIDFDALAAVNKDTSAWLYSPDTAIDYPVLKSEDDTYYLTRLPDGTPNANGSLFIDCRNTPDFRDPLTVVYGHHMKSGRMFGSLEGYKKQEYYGKHPFMYLLTRQENYRIDLLYGCVIDAEIWRKETFMHAENIGVFLAYAQDNTTFESRVNDREGDRIVALATCSYEFDDARYVVIGILSPLAPL